jgi:hypothetical protein
VLKQPSACTHNGHSTAALDCVRDCVPALTLDTVHLWARNIPRTCVPQSRRFLLRIRRSGGGPHGRTKALLTIDGVECVTGSQDQVTTSESRCISCGCLASWSSSEPRRGAGRERRRCITAHTSQRHHRGASRSKAAADLWLAGSATLAVRRCKGKGGQGLEEEQAGSSWAGWHEGFD